MNNKTIIFTDGSSRGNPGPGGWGAIVATSDGKVKELGGGEKHTTNNRMELMGAISALSILDNNDSIILNTDSSYVINGITKWVYGWQKNGWKNSMKEDVVNRDLWEKLIEVSKDKDIKWNYVGGHVGIPGNERCDEIATMFADGKRIELFHGKKTDYEVDLLNTAGDGEKKKTKKKSGATAYSYLSLVEGKLQKHKTWPECEKRVKGVKGNVKFKKSVSEEDEKEIMREWLNQSTSK
ncbi:MAG: ribonuclease HI [Candidatus Paceibacterota bacterium]|jgi:ribonuclease HI